MQQLSKWAVGLGMEKNKRKRVSKNHLKLCDSENLCMRLLCTKIKSLYPSHHAHFGSLKNYNLLDKHDL